MKLKLFTLLTLTILIAGLVNYNGGLSMFQIFNTAYAVGDLTVDWGEAGEGNVGPLFTVENMAPGDSKTHSVTVTNGSPEVRPVGLRGVVTTETGNLASGMEISIERNGAAFYGGILGKKTMEQFFLETTLPNSVELDTIAPSESRTYTITVTFSPDAGNEYQNTDLTFNLIIGIASNIPPACQEIHFNGETIYGTSGNDRLRGTNKNDLIIALEGDDVIDGSNGHDCIISLTGNTKIDGGNGNDVIVSGSGDDIIDGGNGRDTIMAGAGNDRITGGNDNDYLAGEDGDDRIDGENGNDTILGVAGDDNLIGGNGNDLLDGGDGFDSADGELGRDTCKAETKKRCEM